MIQLSIDFYKYGSFKNTEIFNFEDNKEILEFIEECEEYTNHVIAISQECGEDCGKWSQKFQFEGKEYNLAADC